MTYFTAVRLYSLFELCLFTALLVVAIGGFSEDAELVLGWSHGIGWILLCIAVAIGLLIAVGLAGLVFARRQLRASA